MKLYTEKFVLVGADYSEYGDECATVCSSCPRSVVCDNGVWCRKTNFDTCYMEKGDSDKARE